MEIKAMEAAVEALLFAMGEAIPVADIAQVLEIDVEDARSLIRNMMTRYDEDDRGVQIIELEDAFQMCTKPSMYDYLIRMTHRPKKHTLTDEDLETLSSIANLEQRKNFCVPLVCAHRKIYPYRTRKKLKNLKWKLKKRLNWELKRIPDRYIKTWQMCKIILPGFLILNYWERSCSKLSVLRYFLQNHR